MISPTKFLLAGIVLAVVPAWGQMHVIGGQTSAAGSELSRLTVQLTTEAFSPTMGRLRGTCSGVLLSAKVVLTAGHCVKSLDDEDIEIRSIKVTVAGRREIEASRWVASPKYKKIPGILNDGSLTPLVDLAIVELKKSALPEGLISTLPTSQISSEADQNFLMAGFGQTDAANKKVGVLTSAWTIGTLSAVDGQDDQISLAGTQACHGDSGGPLFQVKSGRYVLVGIISNGRSDCLGGTKVMSVFRHLDWILKLKNRLQN